MKIFLTGLVAAGMIATSVAQVNSQTSTTGSSQTNVSASKSGASAKTNNSADANQNVKAGKKANANASGSASQNASASTNGIEVPSGTKVPAVLDKSVDSRKCKQGDEVVAKTTQDVVSHGKVIIPRNSKLIGHVTEASAKANGEAESKLGIVFDKAVLRNGSSVPMQARIQALAAPVVTAAGSMSDDSAGSAPIGSAGTTSSAGGSANGGLVGGAVGGATHAVGSAASTVGSTAGGVAGSAGSTVDSATGATVGGVAKTTNGSLGANGALSNASSGVIGLKNLTLNSDTAGTAGTSLITSTGKNVKLDSGSRLMLDVVGSASTSTSN